MNLPKVHLLNLFFLFLCDMFLCGIFITVLRAFTNLLKITARNTSDTKLFLINHKKYYSIN